MATDKNKQDLEDSFRRIFISECFSELEYSQFCEFCSSSNILYVDELQPYDYVAFRTQYQRDPEFVREIRAKAEAILSDKGILTSNVSNSKPVSHDFEVNSKKSISGKQNTSWEGLLKATADAYMDYPLDGLPIPNRVLHRLVRSGITTIGEMLLTTPEQFLSLGFFGEHSLSVIKSVSENLIRDYNNQKLSSNNPPSVSDFTPDIYQGTVLQEQAVENLDKQGTDHYYQQANYLDETIPVSALIVVSVNSTDLPLRHLKLTLRTHNRLLYGGFKTVGKVLLATDEQLLNIRHLGLKCQ